MPKHSGLYQLELVSDEIHEVISYRPHWIVRKGNLVFLLIILILLLSTWFIKYPDTVNASARLVAVDPPKLITAKADGRLIKLFVRNEQAVTKGQHLGYIESTAHYEQVLKLQDWINKALETSAENDSDILVSNPLPQLFKLGELQRGYQSFENEFVEIKQILVGRYYQKKRKALEQDIQYINTLEDNTYRQKKLLESDRQLQQNEYSAYETLAKDKVIAPLELNQYKSKLIAKDQSLEQVNAQITNNDINKQNKVSELLDLQKIVTDQRQKFHSALLDLKSEVEGWIRQYVLVSSGKGKVSFFSSLQENDMVANGQELFFVGPGETRTYVELMAAQNRLGKIKTGQKVTIKVQSYPSSEFGYLSGVISYISNMPSRSNSFLIKVDLPEGLRTNYNKTIFFRNDLSAEAQIITDNRKLFDRMLGQLKQIWER